MLVHTVLRLGRTRHYLDSQDNYLDSQDNYLDSEDNYLDSQDNPLISRVLYFSSNAKTCQASDKKMLLQTESEPSHSNHSS